MSIDYDILIVGGGMVGASLARALGGTGLSVAVVEAVTPEASEQPSYDDRVIALSWGSRRILDTLGVWGTIDGDAEPIRRIHVSDRGHFGFTRLDGTDHAIPALGYVATARSIGSALLEGIENQEGLEWICPARVQRFQVEADRVEVVLASAGSETEVSARLLVAADGGDSRIRKLLGVPVRDRDYRHAAVIANVTPHLPHGGTAYERFTDTGPLAMLPMSGARCSLVWTQPSERVDDVLGWDDETFLRRLQERFGFRLGRLRRVGRRSAYPLRLVRADKTVLSRVALIGNAAHTLHPVAGQGFNLGLRDVAELAEVMADAREYWEDPGAMAVLERYAARRLGDQRRAAMITDVLARLFVNPLAPIRALRGLAMLTLDMTPPIKNGVTSRFMGVHDRLPRLARGLPLRGRPRNQDP